jgi:diacylglycerol kinase (ATP)
MKKKILFIINPISGAGSSGTVEKSITENLNRDIFEFEVVYTKAAKHATDLSKLGVQKNFDVIVAVGGDGSVNEVGRGLIGSKSVLGIIPCGSGNGTARHLKIPVNVPKAIDIINQGKSMLIDTFSLNNETVLNVAGIGYAAHVAYEFSRLQKRGFINYLKIAVRDSFRYKSQSCMIEVLSPAFSFSERPSGNKINLEAFIIDIANGAQWGNNAVIAPNAKNNDGLLDLCMIRSFPFLYFPVMAVRLFTNSIHHSKYMEIIKIKEVVIDQKHQHAHIDGEPVRIGNRLIIKINPLSLHVIVP